MQILWLREIRSFIIYDRAFVELKGLDILMKRGVLLFFGDENKKALLTDQGGLARLLLNMQAYYADVAGRH